MRRPTLVTAVSFLLLTVTAPLSSASPDAGHGPSKAGLIELDGRSRAYGLRTARSTSPAAVVASNFEVVGHSDLGARDTNGDVWVHGDFAYVGTWSEPCTGRGVKIIDVSTPASPRMIGRVANRPGTSAEDVVVRHVSTPSFTGDLLAVGLQRCGSQRALDARQFGPQFWDVTDPFHPHKLSFLGLTTGGGGVHELDLFQRGSNVYALVATPFSEAFDPVPAGDFRIIDVTDPDHPMQVSAWGAIGHGLSPGPFFGMGSFGATFAHSARASADGTRAYVSYWDLGVLTFDITDVTNPVQISRTHYPPDSDGDAHSVSVYQGTSRRFLLQNDEDFDPRSPAHILYGPGPTIGSASESPGGIPLWLEPAHSLTAPVVRAAGEGCNASDYPAATAGRIAVVRTPFPFFDPDFIPGVTDEPDCLQQEQEAAAQAAGAVAVVHDFIATATSPQFFDFGSVEIPVLFTDHATAQGMVSAGSATLQALPPSWGFMRVVDAATGIQVAKFDGAPNVHTLPPPAGFWSIHNNEVVGNRSFASWYTNGVVALDLSPLNGPTPGDPVMVGQFLPAGAPSHVDFIPGNIPVVWGVAVQPGDPLIYVSDMNSGLWIVRPTGPAAP